MCRIGICDRLYTSEFELSDSAGAGSNSMEPVAGEGWFGVPVPKVDVVPSFMDLLRESVNVLISFPAIVRSLKDKVVNK